MRKLNRHDIKKLEDLWIAHEENKKKLKYREWEIFSKNNDDENTGGGANSVRSIGKPTETLAIKLAEDNLYQNLVTITKAVESIYERSDINTKSIVESRYWNDDIYVYEWDEIADELGLSRSSVLRLRNSLLNETAKEIGWV